MTKRQNPPQSAAQHRSGAVARMLRMPVATLRVWERRYRLSTAPLSPGGQRLYSDADVRRLALLKQLSDLGHAIGSLAALDMTQLQRVAATHAQTLASLQPAPPRQPPTPWRLVVVGQALGRRLQRPALLRQLGRPLELLGPFDDVAQARAALAARGADAAAQAWLLQLPQLHADLLSGLDGAQPVAVLYGFAADAVCEALAARGVALLREPQPDAALGQWLGHWAAAQQPAAAPAAAATVPPRRWDEAALAEVAALSSTVACECPRHVAELLLQLARFEAYSAQCAQRSPADAALHTMLGRVAAEARSGFEGALLQVALHEGLLLPPAAG